MLRPVPPRGFGSLTQAFGRCRFRDRIFEARVRHRIGWCSDLGERVDGFGHCYITFGWFRFGVCPLKLTGFGDVPFLGDHLRN